MAASAAAASRHRRPLSSLLLLLLLAATAALAYRDHDDDDGSDGGAFSLGRWGQHQQQQEEALELQSPQQPQHRALRRRHHRGQGQGQQQGQQPKKKAAAFDFYVLATFWPAELCHRETTTACATPEPWWRVNMTGHGLWPNNKDGTYPQFCGGEKYNSSIIDNDITLPVMLMLWPNYHHDISEGEQIYDDFWAHEWNKHGTCSGLSQDAYFKLALKGFLVATPPALTAASQAGTRTMPLTDLQNMFGGPTMAVLQCGASRYFQAVYTCWSKDPSTNAPLARIECPPAVANEATCKATTIQIPLFQ